jgi:PTS system beta-glucosides-specific IIC component
VRNEEFMAERKKKDWLFEFVNAVFTPILPAIIAAGLIKAVLAVAVLCGLDTQSHTYYFMNLIGDAPIYFLPVMLAYTSSKKFGCNSFIAVAIAGAMLHPQYAALIKEAYSLKFSSFLGIPVALVHYNSSVLPAILMTAVLARFERLCNQLLPALLRSLFTPLLCVLIVAPLTFLVLGPAGYLIGLGISSGLNILTSHVGWLVPTLIGTFMPLLVSTGMHMGLAPFQMQAIAAHGYETICGPGCLPSNIAQGAASLAVAIRAKDPSQRETAMSAGTTALCGITEPALFGVTLKNRRVLYCVMTGGFFGGLFAGITGVKTFTFCAPGVLALVAYIGDDGIRNLLMAVVSMVISFIITFILTYIWGYRTDLNLDRKDSQTSAI